jgi:hypothetical protein
LLCAAGVERLNGQFANDINLVWVAHEIARLPEVFEKPGNWKGLSTREANLMVQPIWHQHT